MEEEREIYLENHPTKANGYYTLHPRPPDSGRTSGGPQTPPRTGRLFSFEDPSLLSLEEAIHWFWVSSVRHGERAGSVNLWKSRWGTTMLPLHSKWGTMPSGGVEVLFGKGKFTYRFPSNHTTSSFKAHTGFNCVRRQHDESPQPSMSR